MMIEKEAKTVEMAIELALQELQVEQDQVDIEVIRKEGLFKTAMVRVRVKSDKNNKALEFVQTLITKMDLDVHAELGEREGNALINITGKDNGIAIGYRGEVLDAIQYLTILATNKGDGEYRKVLVDAENYREKRKETLRNLALRLADKATKTGRSVEVEPMNPYERKVFHTALADVEDIMTESEGEEPNRYIVITPLKTSSQGGLNDFSRKGLGKIKTYGNKKRKF